MRSSKPVLLAATCLVLSATTMSASERTALPFIEDDYARAVADAQARKLPIFADVWTAW